MREPRFAKGIPDAMLSAIPGDLPLPILYTVIARSVSDVAISSPGEISFLH
jgi:hypothetical protein